jgi:mannose-1-phosphate guanylyltransferase
MAGGSGTRFWPLSRRALPKQFLPLGGEKSLIRETYERLLPLAGPSRIWVVSGRAHVDRVRKELPELPRSRILGEPVGRNTAPCIGLAAHRVLRVDPDAAILVCPADHIIRPPRAFGEAVRGALRVLDATDAPGAPATVTFGIVPRYPATGFGYIERGAQVSAHGLDGISAFTVAGFREKPAEEVARAYVEGGRHYWNSGIFLWKARGVLELIAKHIPDLSSGLRGIDEAGGGSDRKLVRALEASFGSLRSISIDYGVLEHALNISVAPVEFEWDDVGSWRAVERYAPRDADGNSVLGLHVGVDTRDCIVVGGSGKRVIGTIGLEDLVIVETEDAVLVCNRNSTERLKEIVDRLTAKKLEKFL